MQRANSLEKTMILGKMEGRRRRGRQRTRWLDGITDSVGVSLSKLWEMVKDREPLRPRGCKESDTTEKLTTTMSRPRHSIISRTPKTKQRY